MNVFHFNINIFISFKTIVSKGFAFIYLYLSCKIIISKRVCLYLLCQHPVQKVKAPGYKTGYRVRLLVREQGIFLKRIVPVFVLTLSLRALVVPHNFLIILVFHRSNTTQPFSRKFQSCEKIKYLQATENIFPKTTFVIIFNLLFILFHKLKKFQSPFHEKGLILFIFRDQYI